jgi:hypothetical protein
MKKFILYKEDRGLKVYYCYTSLVGVLVTSTDKREAKVIEDGNSMRKFKNALNKRSSENWHSEPI